VGPARESEAEALESRLLTLFQNWQRLFESKILLVVQGANGNKRLEFMFLLREALIMCLTL
jgi:hypothetical protein